MRQLRTRRIRRRHFWALTLLSAILTTFSPFRAAAQDAGAGAAAAAPGVTYARVADLVTASSAIATVRVRAFAPVPPARATGLPAGQVRYYVEADALGLIRGTTVLSRRVSFLLDLPATDRKPDLKKRSFLIFGRIGNQVDYFQLLSSSALIDWTPANEALVRKVLADAIAPDAPPAITGISSVFHVAGAIQGEGETQIFLSTGDGSPISLSIIRRPDEKPLLAVALGEVVDDNAIFPKPDTMLWYRLSCGLPRAIPPKTTEGLAMADIDAARRDYAAFLAALAPCDRTGAPPA